MLNSRSRRRKHGGYRTDPKSLTPTCSLNDPRLTRPLVLFPFRFYIYLSLSCLCTPSLHSQPPLLTPSPQNTTEQQTQIVAINFRLFYGGGLVAHLWVNSSNRHLYALLLEQKNKPTPTSPCPCPLGDCSRTDVSFIPPGFPAGFDQSVL